MMYGYALLLLMLCGCSTLLVDAANKKPCPYRKKKPITALPALRPDVPTMKKKPCPLRKTIKTPELPIETLSTKSDTANDDDDDTTASTKMLIAAIQANDYAKVMVWLLEQSAIGAIETQKYEEAAKMIQDLIDKSFV